MRNFLEIQHVKILYVDSSEPQVLKNYIYIMRKFITFTFGLLLITFTSCNSNNKSETPVKKENEAQLGRELTKEETRAMERIENET